ncbi:uncharacterized protein LOC122655711 [Telopea speciosissima]|uniref:uncharacterized protein LOC122655711 n=1 Tax=Telopea speciosissima TaxID=54955 RepID=UPI001CC71F6F|nr:uncharacterized protein LOC122655711 [Telopea speciosissima]
MSIFTLFPDKGYMAEAEIMRTVKSNRRGKSKDGTTKKSGEALSEMSFLFKWKNRWIGYQMASSSNPTPMTVIWNASELEKFINLMVENARNGQKTNSTFTKVGWNNIKTGLEAAFQRPFNKEQLRNKMYKLRSDYDSFKQLLETTGFGWDSNTRTATAEDSIWDLAVKANPIWSKFRKSGLPWWPELQEIFSEHYAQADRGVTPQSVKIPSRISIEPDYEVEMPTQGSPLFVGLDDIEHTDVEEVTPTPTTVIWTASVLEKFINLMVDNARDGTTPL